MPPLLLLLLVAVSVAPVLQLALLSPLSHLSASPYVSAYAYAYAYSAPPPRLVGRRSTYTSRSTLALRLSGGPDSSSSGVGDGTATTTANTDKKRTPGRSKGVYARPSAAIERGSGFFVPGLEGSRVRFLFGILALVLTYVNNHVGTAATTAAATATARSTGGYGISETVALLSGALLLLQAAVEFGAEVGFGIDLGGGGDSSGGSGARGVESSDPTASAPSSSLEQRISPELLIGGASSSPSSAADAVRWVGATYVALTPATHVLLIGDDGDGGVGGGGATTLYKLGDFGSDNAGDGGGNAKVDDDGGGIKAALDEVYSSKGGRISVPSDHPASVGLLPEMGRRCVLLQRVEEEEGSRKGEGGRTCLVVGSNQLLPSFTKYDLRWLGRFGSYVGKELS